MSKSKFAIKAKMVYTCLLTTGKVSYWQRKNMATRQKPVSELTRMLTLRNRFIY